MSLKFKIWFMNVCLTKRIHRQRSWVLPWLPLVRRLVMKWLWGLLIISCILGKLKRRELFLWHWRCLIFPTLKLVLWISCWNWHMILIHKLQREPFLLLVLSVPVPTTQDLLTVSENLQVTTVKNHNPYSASECPKVFSTWEKVCFQSNHTTAKDSYSLKLVCQVWSYSWHLCLISRAHCYLNSITSFTSCRWLCTLNSCSSYNLLLT